jgi:hypothetical protein
MFDTHKFEKKKTDQSAVTDDFNQILYIKNSLIIYIYTRHILNI